MAGAGVGAEVGGGGGRHRLRHGGGCDQSVHGGCDGAQMMSQYHWGRATNRLTGSQSRSIEAPKRVVQKIAVVVVQGGRSYMVLISTKSTQFQH